VAVGEGAIAVAGAFTLKRCDTKPANLSIAFQRRETDNASDFRVRTHGGYAERRLDAPQVFYELGELKGRGCSRDEGEPGPDGSEHKLGDRLQAIGGAACVN
jgi:hypothetical protein